MSSKSDLAISIRGLSKSYTIAHQAQKSSTLAEAVMTRIRHPFRRNPKEVFWALKDVSFDIKKGEVVGVIGRNGAGKSTLLKILSRITEPTAGEIDIRGRVGSLLEVGTGFHQELTGRENIFLNGAILGMTRREIAKEFDAIVEFAGVEKFLDTPVKRYSSGMYVRLAFAVAAHLRSEILVIDEVLAVGDVSFQRKCLEKVSEVARDGRTILFVSHNMGIVRTSCKNGVLLRLGEVAVKGGIEDVVTAYDQDLSSATGDGVWINPYAGNPSDEASIERVELVGEDALPRRAIRSSETAQIRFHIVVRAPSPLLKFGFDLVRGGVTVFRSQQVDSRNQEPVFERGRHIVSCQLPADFLFEGDYYVTPIMTLHSAKSLLYPSNPQLRFKVDFDPSGSDFHNILTPENHPGVIFPILEWTSQVVRTTMQEAESSR